MEFRGRRDRGLKFIKPYRNIGELNPVEQLKLSRHPFEVAQAVIDTYSKQGADSINKVPGEQERLKWVGMYPQRQGGDAFMMRIKVPGGVMTAAQVREIGVAADAFAEGPDESPVFGNRYADLTTQAGHSAPLDPHRRRPPHLAAILGRGVDHGPGLWRLGPQRLLVPRLRHRREGGRRRAARGGGDLGVLHGQS